MPYQRLRFGKIPSCSSSDRWCRYCRHDHFSCVDSKSGRPNGQKFEFYEIACAVTLQGCKTRLFDRINNGLGSSQKAMMLSAICIDRPFRRQDDFRKDIEMPPRWHEDTDGSDSENRCEVLYVRKQYDEIFSLSSKTILLLLHKAFDDLFGDILPKGIDHKRIVVINYLE